MSDQISREEIVDILAKMKFFQGQRAGRELWNDKPFEVQEQDLESFNKGIETIRKYILQLEEQPPVEPVRGKWIIEDKGLATNANTWKVERKFSYKCNMCGYHTGNQGKYFNFCPECGADMRGEKE